MGKGDFILDVSNMTVASFWKFLTSEDLRLGSDCHIKIEEIEKKTNFSNDISLGEFVDKNYKVSLIIKQWRKKIRFSP